MNSRRKPEFNYQGDLPQISYLSTRDESGRLDAITAILFNQAVIEVKQPVDENDKYVQVAGILASMGFTVPVISKQISESASTVRRRISASFDQLNIKSHDQLAPVLIETGVLIHVEPGASLQLSNRQTEIVALKSAGHTHKEVAEELYISPFTVKNHLQVVSTRTRLPQTSGIILGALGSGELLPDMSDDAIPNW